MKITELLKNNEATINYEDKKLFYSEGNCSWCVIKRKHYKHNYEYLIITLDEDEAVDILING